MNLVEIEAKKKILEDTKKSALDAANLALAPLQSQIGQLENQSHRIALDATERISRIDGQLALLDELRAEFTGPLPVDTTLPTKPNLDLSDISLQASGTVS